MAHCPVCDAPLSGPVCAACGFDISRRYDIYPTFAPLSGVDSLSGSRADRETRWLRCDSCGSTAFRFRLDDCVPVCLRCRKEAAPLAPPRPVITAISQGYRHTVALYSDGTVRAAGRNNNGQCDVRDWKDIIAISAGYRFTVGLKKDGTVVSTGERTQHVVQRWSGIVAIAAGDDFVLGLRKDGTVVHTHRYSWSQNNDLWQNLKDVSAGKFFCLGLHSDGTVSCSDYRATLHWADIIALAGGSSFFLGLRKDGTVAAMGKDDDGQCRVKDWSGITAVAAGDFHAVGLTKNGTLVHAGYSGNGLLSALKWTDITAVAAGGLVTVGLKKDGTLVCTDADIEAEFQSMD